MACMRFEATSDARFIQGHPWGLRAVISAPVRQAQGTHTSPRACFACVVKLRRVACRAFPFLVHLSSPCSFLLIYHQHSVCILHHHHSFFQPSPRRFASIYPRRKSRPSAQPNTRLHLHPRSTTVRFSIEYGCSASVPDSLYGIANNGLVGLRQHDENQQFQLQQQLQLQQQHCALSR